MKSSTSRTGLNNRRDVKVKLSTKVCSNHFEAVYRSKGYQEYFQDIYNRLNSQIQHSDLLSALCNKILILFEILMRF